MYENIRKPGWLRSTPALLIRSMPAVYYYAKYHSGGLSGAPAEYFRWHVRYLGAALDMLGQTLAIDDFREIAVHFDRLVQAAPAERLGRIETAIRSMTSGFTSWNETVRDHHAEWAPKLKQLYRSIVHPLQITLVDYRGDPARIERLRQQLAASCGYTVTCIPAVADTYQAQILDAACIVLTDIQPSRLHQDHDRIRSYRKPVVVIIPRDEKQDIQRTAVRHAGQLARIGVDLLIHYITPIRLYTTIEKNYMRFYAQPG